MKELTDENVVIVGGRTLNADGTGFGIVIFRAPPEAAVKKIMDGDPAVQKGVLHATLFPFEIGMMESKPHPRSAKPTGLKAGP